MIGKNSGKLLDYAKQSARDSLQISSKTVLHEAAEAAGDLIGNKIDIKIYISRKNSRNYFLFKTKITV